MKLGANAIELNLALASDHTFFENFFTPSTSILKYLQ